MQLNSIKQLRRSMAYRYLLALSIIGVLSTGAFYSLITALEGADSTALVVNMAGKQRMLTQHISLDVHEIHSQRQRLHGQDLVKQAESSRISLISNLNEITQTNEKLTGGNLSEEFSTTLSKTIYEMYFGELDLAQRVINYVLTARQILPANTSAESLDVVQKIDRLSEPLLNDLDSVVSQYQREGEQKLSDIKLMGFWVWIITLITLLLEVVFIFWPLQEEIVAAKEAEKKVNEHLNELVESRTKKLKEANHKLSVLAQHDPLTGLKNRLTLEGEIERLISGYQRHGVPFAVVMLDIDWFKKVNDQYGHAAGDFILMELAHVLSNQVRESDEIYRAGGEEFVLVLNRINLKDALELLESLRQTIAGHVFSYLGTPLMITISCGIYHTDHATVKSVKACLMQADDAMYQSKKNGRNRITQANGKTFP